MHFGLQKLTLLDFPGFVACTVFSAGCNFRCPFCHNASLVMDIPVMFLVMALLTLPALLRKKLSRWQGIVLLLIYAAFCVIQFTM